LSRKPIGNQRFLLLRRISQIIAAITMTKNSAEAQLLIPDRDYGADSTAAVGNQGFITGWFRKFSKGARLLRDGHHRQRWAVLRE